MEIVERGGSRGYNYKIHYLLMLFRQNNEDVATNRKL